MSQYTDENFKREDWELIQDSILENISYLKSTQKWGYEEQVERLEALLEKARISRLRSLLGFDIMNKV
jgi:hypothetical protein